MAERETKVGMSLKSCHASALEVFGGGHPCLTGEAGCLRKGEIELEGSGAEGVNLAEFGDGVCMKEMGTV